MARGAGEGGCEDIRKQKQKTYVCTRARMYVECVRPRFFPSMWHLDISYPLRSQSSVGSEYAKCV